MHRDSIQSVIFTPGIGVTRKAHESMCVAMSYVEGFHCPPHTLVQLFKNGEMVFSRTKEKTIVGILNDVLSKNYQPVFSGAREVEAQGTVFTITEIAEKTFNRQKMWEFSCEVVNGEHLIVKDGTEYFVKKFKYSVSQDEVRNNQVEALNAAGLPYGPCHLVATGQYIQLRDFEAEVTDLEKPF